jgi:hypothetical protein
MADLVLTAANVAAGTGARVEHGTAGAAVTAGQVVYADSATNTYKLADNNSGTADARVPAGIALHAAASGQPLAILTAGLITIGATVAIGTIYVLSATAGGIAPAADLASGNYSSVLGIATTAAMIDVNIDTSGVAVP